MVAGGVYHNTENRVNVVNQILYLGGLFASIGLQILITSFNQNAENACVFVNGLLGLSNGGSTKSSIKVHNDYTHFANAGFSYLIYLETFIVPMITVYGIHGLEPCKPSLSGYFFIAECNHGGFATWNILPISENMHVILKLGIFIVNHWFWAYSYSIMGVCVGGIMSLCTVSFAHCLKSCIQDAPPARSYWKKLALNYRKLQVGAIMMNEVQQKVLLTLVITASIVMFPISANLLIRNSQAESNIFVLALPGVILVGSILVMLFVLGGMSQLSLYSELYIRHGKQLPVKYPRIAIERRLSLKFWRSCSIITAKFGSINFVDVLTPLNCIDFANHLTLQLLLLIK